MLSITDNAQHFRKLCKSFEYVHTVQLCGCAKLCTYNCTIPTFYAAILSVGKLCFIDPTQCFQCTSNHQKEAATSS